MLTNHQPGHERLAYVRRRLGKPAYECGDVLLYVGDAVELMARMPDGSVDLTVTSPPYNIGKEYERALPMSEYIEWSRSWLSGIPRITASGGAFWLNLGYAPVAGEGKAVPLPYLLWDKVDMFLIQEIVWNYGAGVAARNSFSPRNEKWLWYVNDPAAYTFNLDAVRDPDVKYPNQRKHGRLRVNPAGKNPSDVWAIPKVTTGEGGDGRRAAAERTSHPAQFPEAVITRIVRACSDPGDILLDPFGGSGTTGAVALATDRACVLFEIRADYAQIAARRLNAIKRSLEEIQSELVGFDVMPHPQT
ncbi:MAG: site-specific DNA-methyltransferase [Enhydrobacter sp.]